MSLKKKAAVVGVYEHPTRYSPSKTSYQLIAESAREALADAGLTIKDVDGMFNAGAGGILGSLALADYLNLNPSYTDTTNFGGSSFVGHAGHAAAAIAGGLCEVALITYSATPVSAADGRRTRWHHGRRSKLAVRAALRRDHHQRLRDDGASPHA